MAKEKNESVNEAKVQEPEKYYITSKVLLEGYFHKIEGKPLGVSQGKMEIRTFQGQKKKVPSYGSVLEYVTETIEGTEQPFEKPTGKTYFEDLTPKQIHELVVAKVIVLNKEQTVKYKEWLINVLYNKKK